MIAIIPLPVKTPKTNFTLVKSFNTLTVPDRSFFVISLLSFLSLFIYNVVSFSLREHISTRKTKRPCYSHDLWFSCITLKWAFFPFGRSSGSTNNRRVHLVSAFSESSITKMPCCLYFDILPIRIPTHNDTNAISTYDKISIYYYPLLQGVSS